MQQIDSPFVPTEFDSQVHSALFTPEHFEQLKQDALVAFADSMSRMTPEFVWAKYAAGKEEHGGLDKETLQNMDFQEEIDKETADVINYNYFDKVKQHGSYLFF